MPAHDSVSFPSVLSFVTSASILVAARNSETVAIGKKSVIIGQLQKAISLLLDSRRHQNEDDISLGHCYILTVQHRP